MSAFQQETKWTFSYGGTRVSYDVESFDELLKELEIDHVKYYALRVGLDPNWRPKQGEQLSPEKSLIHQLLRIFSQLKIIINSQPLREKPGLAVMDLMDCVQGIAATVGIEAYYEGVNELWMWVHEQVKEGELVEGKYHKDLLSGLKKLQSLWLEEREGRLMAELQMQRIEARSTEKKFIHMMKKERHKKFIEAVKLSKRTKKGKIIYSDVARHCKRLIPLGFDGRKIDDKYAKELCRSWKIK